MHLRDEEFMKKPKYIEIKRNVNLLRQVILMEMNHLSQSLKLTLEQEFQLRLVEESAQEISHEEALSLLIQTSKLLMIKDNVIRSLMKDRVII
jgi:hypothetical protein